MNITKNTGTVNTTRKAGRDIKYIVLHYTAGTKSTKGSASSVASYFKGGSASGSADFIVDDETIVQYNGDIKNRYCWAVGGNKYTKINTSVGGTYYNKCTNANSISIEMCSNKTNKGTLNASDTDWYLTDKTVDNAVKLTKYLMQTYNIQISNVIMHHHVTGKICPNPWCVNEQRLSNWNEFKSKLKGDDEMVTSTNMIFNCKTVSVERILKNGTNYIKLRELEKLGLKIGYDKNTKTVTVNS